jgi:hypothetical protein
LDWLAFATPLKKTPIPDRHATGEVIRQVCQKPGAVFPNQVKEQSLYITPRAIRMRPGEQLSFSSFEPLA